MTPEDLDEVMEIEQYSFPTPWSRTVYEHDLKRNPKSRFYVARSEDDDELLGYIGNWVIEDECHVGTIASKREFRGRGIAEALLIHTARTSLAESVTYIILEVRENNFAAINLYRKLGFQQVGLRRGYYRDTGEDALLLTLHNLESLAAREIPSTVAQMKEKTVE
jgi:ribosomal-protein-alanine N-acetyltransferase